MHVMLLCRCHGRAKSAPGNAARATPSWPRASPERVQAAWTAGLVMVQMGSVARHTMAKSHKLAGELWARMSRRMSCEMGARARTSGRRVTPRCRKTPCGSLKTGLFAWGSLKMSRPVCPRLNNFRRSRQKLCRTKGGSPKLANYVQSGQYRPNLADRLGSMSKVRTRTTCPQTL